MGSGRNGILAGLSRFGVACAAAAMIGGWIPAGLPSGTVQKAYADDGTADVYGRLSSGTKVDVERKEPYIVPDHPTVYLTFDDGPSKNTGPVLDILKREKIQATFFIVGQSAEENKDLVRRIADEGHSIGNHSYDHVYKELYLSFKGYWKQTEETERILEGITGMKPFLLRAPGGTAGNYDAYYFYMLERAGFSVVDWNVDSGDAKRAGVKAEEILNEVKRAPLKHEMTVLMHDGTGHGETVKALPDIISYFRDQGYSFAAIDGKVKPEQFRSLHSKWARVYSKADFESDLKMAEAAAGDRGILAPEDRKSGTHESEQGKESRREGEQPPMRMEQGEQKPASGGQPSDAVSVSQGALVLPRLSIGIGGAENWSLGGMQYAFDGERLAVPLRSLAERLGGRYDWDGDSDVASVRLGNEEVIFDPLRRTVKMSLGGFGARSWSLADLSWKGGEIMVPLRATAALFGSGVTSYSLERSEYRVELAGREMLAFDARPDGAAGRREGFALLFERLRPRIS